MRQPDPIAEGASKKEGISTMNLVFAEWSKGSLGRLTLSATILTVFVLAAVAMQISKSALSTEESVSLSDHYAQSRPPRQIVQANCTFPGFRSSNCARIQTAVLLLD
jgi:hypothetical protein